MAPAPLFVDLRHALAVAALALIALAAAAPSAWAQAPPAAQGWQICNQTSFVVEVAHGRPEGRSTLVQGWLRLRPGECRVAAPAPLARGVHYLFGRTSTAHRGGRRQWGGVIGLCVDPTATFVSENPPRCASMGLEERRFREVRINQRDRWRTILSEAEPYTLSRARAAGLQRLLADAGVDTRSGGDPRRLNAAIQKFREDARLPANASQDQMIDSLEAAARRRAEGLGLTLCNRAAEPIWAAIARRRGEGWESRGWWPLAPGGCARTIDDSLLPGVYFVHAVMTGKEGERFLSAGGETFCVAATRFAILGREECGERQYDEAVFAAFSPPRDREGLLVELKENDFLPPGVRPRRVATPQMNDARAPPPETDPGRAPRRGAPPRDAAPTVDRPPGARASAGAVQ